MRGAQGKIHWIGVMDNQSSQLRKAMEPYTRQHLGVWEMKGGMQANLDR
jgi:hypothetical protein